MSTGLNLPTSISRREASQERGHTLLGQKDDTEGSSSGPSIRLGGSHNAGEPVGHIPNKWEYTGRFLAFDKANVGINE